VPFDKYKKEMIVKKGESQDEKTTFDKFKLGLRNGVYGGFYVLLQDTENASLWKFGIFYLILLL
jgi:hypothetical protein